MKENKLIAEFMGLKYYEPFFEVTDESQMEKIEVRKGKAISFGYMFEPHELRYHESWDWLMPVVEKIECTTIDNDDNSDNFFNVMIEVFECNINGGDICICKSGNTKLEATYKAVVEFINQYNEENESKD